MRQQRCPKCGKLGWTQPVTKHSLKGLDRVDWHYIRYRHYAGSKKTVSLKTVEAVLRHHLSEDSVRSVMSMIKERQIQKRVDHYVKVS